jgi:hypothetical protein
VQPKLRLRLIGPNGPPEIFLGKDSAFEGKMYVRFADSKDVLHCRPNGPDRHRQKAG